MDMQNFPVEAGLTELIDADDAAMAQNTWGKSVAITVGATACAGYIDALVLVASGGAVIESTGQVVFFDADPAIAAADTNITVAEAKSIIGFWDVASGDWFKEGGGTAAAAVAHEMLANPIPFHHVTTLYAAFYNTGATTINDGAGDDEELHLNFWYRKAA